MTGIAAEKGLPLKWSDKENVRWRVELPGPGNSSPIVWGDRVFLAQYLAKDNRRTLMCLDRATGKLIWQSGLTYNEEEPTQENNPYCSGSPATDGERVYVCFGSAGVSAYDFQGKEAWHHDLGKLNHMFGNAVSPVLYGDLCILNYGPDEKARLVALDKKTGQLVWEAQPPAVEPSEQEQPMRGGPGGGPGRGPRGGGNFGPGMMVAPQILAQADKNGDQALSKEEFTGLADEWMDKMDADKAGKLSQEQFTQRLKDVLPPPQRPGGRESGGGDGGPPGGGGRAFGPAGFVGPVLFAAADMDKDGWLTRSELKATFEKWFTAWDSDKSGSLNEDKLREGFNGALPRPNFGGPGGGRGPGGRGGGSPNGSWSTPLVLRSGSRDELIVSFPYRLASYDPKTGQQFWLARGLGGSMYTSPLWGDGVIVAMSSGMGGGPAIAVKPGGSGDVTETQRLWRLDRTSGRIGSGVIFEGHIYGIADTGVAECFDLKTGDRLWSERLQGQAGRNSSWSSMILADGKIYIPNQSGEVFVVRASPQFELLATNSVGEPTNASLAAAQGDLFMHTDKSLWCFASLPKP